MEQSSLNMSHLNNLTSKLRSSYLFFSDLIFNLSVRNPLIDISFTAQTNQNIAVYGLAGKLSKRAFL
jgi:hypothetical protein